MTRFATCETCDRWSRHRTGFGLCHRWGALVPTEAGDYCSAHPARATRPEGEVIAQFYEAIDSWGQCVIDEGWHDSVDDGDIALAVEDLIAHIRSEGGQDLVD